MTQKKPVGIVAELVSLLKTITANGQVTEDQISQVDSWLAAKHDCTLPELELLRATSAAIRINGSVSKEGRRAFHKAVERVLPPEERRHSKAVRRAYELADQAKQKDDREAAQSAKRASKEKARADAAATRERNRVVHSSNFLVSGTSYENRCSAIRSYLKEGQAVILKRDPHNEYDSCAIKIFARHSGNLYDIGYVPRELTPALAPLMDRPHKYVATCTKILRGDRLIPVVDVTLYGPNADIATQATEPQVSGSSPKRRTWADLEAAAQAEQPVREAMQFEERTSTRQPEAARRGPLIAVIVLAVAALLVLLGLAIRE